MILSLRTDKPEAEAGLYDGEKQLTYVTWEAHRKLAATIHSRIEEILSRNELDWKDIEAIIFYKGPGSFTGLRIGASVCNALADVNKIHIAGTSGESWISDGMAILNENPARQVLPEYGSDPFTSAPKK